MLAKDVISRVKKLEIKTRKMVESITAGAYHSVFKGAGIEFEDVREYTQDDDVKDIDWNVTARVGTPYIKKYVEERELRVVLAVDMSASGLFGSGAKSKNETMLELASLLAFSAIRNNDKVGLLLFTDKIELYLPPKSGRLHVLRVIRELMIDRVLSKGTDISLALDRILKILKKRSVIFLISDFIDNPERYKKLLQAVSRKHDLIAVRILDKIEKDWNIKGNFLLTDSETGKNISMQTSKARLESYLKETQSLQLVLDNLCLASKIDKIELVTNDDIIKPLMKFFKNRERMSHRA